MPHLESLTEERGTIIVCGAGPGAKNPWIRSYNHLLGRYGLTGTGANRAAGLHVFANTHWHQSKGIAINFRTRWGLPEFSRHASSYSSVSQAIASAGPTFEAELESILAPYCDPSGHVDVEQVNWGVPYRRQRVMPAAYQGL